MYSEDTTLSSGAPGYVVVAEQKYGVERHYLSPKGGWLHSINRGGARVFESKEDAMPFVEAAEAAIPTRNIYVIPDSAA